MQHKTRGWLDADAAKKGRPRVTPGGLH